MSKNILFLLAIFVLLTSCKTGVDLTFTNYSKEDFKTLTIGIFDKRFDFENLNSGQTTQLIRVDKVYPYCYARAVTKKDTIRFIPIDFIGEKIKKHGKLNLKINIDTTSNTKRELNFITEKD